MTRPGDSATGAGIDVVVVSWRSREMTLRCLEHLGKGQVAHRLILVDNDSRDGTVEAVRERWPDATIVETGDNLGFGRAVNRGVAAGSGDAIVLVNNDLFVDPGFLERIVAPLTDARVGMVAGVTRMPDEAVIDGAGVDVDRSLCAFNALAHRPIAELPSADPGIPSAGAAAYRRAAFEEAGGFDELLFAYGEDVDLGLRLARAGWQFRLAREAQGVHLGGASAGKASDFQRRLSGTARGFLLRRYRLSFTGFLRALLTEPAVLVFDALTRRDLIMLRGMLHGWRLARSRGRRLELPDGVIDHSIGPIRSLARRRAS